MGSGPVVFIVDDDEAVRKSIVAVLETMGVEAQAYASAEEFIEAYDERHPGCLVLDVRMPGMSGLELQAELVKRQITLPVIIISGHGDIAMAVEAVKLGALNFIEKPFRSQVLWDNVNKALAIDERVQQDRTELESIKAGFALLTPRERDVMKLVIAGKSSKQIAAELGVSRRTVESHRERIMKKVGIKSAVQLTRLAMKAGVL